MRSEGMARNSPAWRPWLFVIVGSTLGALGYLVARAEVGRQRAEERAENMQRTVAAVGMTVEQLTRRMSRAEQLRLLPATLAADQERASASGSASVSAASSEPSFEEEGDQSSPHNDDELVEQERRRTLQRVTQLETLVDGESRDFGWAKELESKVQTVMSGLDAKVYPSTRLLKADCRSTVCLVKVETASSREGELFPPIINRLGYRTFGSAEVDPRTGKATWTVFMAREGYDLPQPAE